MDDGEWELCIERPTMDWSALPAWAVSIAQDDIGEWYWYGHMPTCGEVIWCGDSKGDFGVIPPEHAPKWSGYWRESWTPVPGREG